jgi:hypothetical protein
MAGLTTASAVVLPGGRCTTGRGSRTATPGLPVNSIVHLTNQSIVGSWLRIAGVGGRQTVLGVLMAAIVGGLGVWAACRWHRRERSPWP